MSNYITPPYPIFTDVTGTPLDAGFVFIGAEDSDAIANPINVYWDKEKTQLADQPLRTRNGYISKDGSPCKIFIDQPSCSIFVKNRFNTAVLNDLSFDILSNSSAVVAAVGAERERAIGVEAVLDQKIESTNTTLDSKITNESSRAQAAELVLQNQVNAVGVGNKAYLTYALMDADKVNIPAKSKVTVTNDTTASNNGDWQWDGVAFTKSAFDPVQISKNNTAQITREQNSLRNYFTTDMFSGVDRSVASSETIVYGDGFVTLPASTGFVLKRTLLAATTISVAVTIDEIAIPNIKVIRRLADNSILEINPNRSETIGGKITLYFDAVSFLSTDIQFSIYTYSRDHTVRNVSILNSNLAYVVKHDDNVNAKIASVRSELTTGYYPKEVINAFPYPNLDNVNLYGDPAITVAYPSLDNIDYFQVTKPVGVATGNTSFAGWELTEDKLPDEFRIDLKNVLITHVANINTILFRVQFIKPSGNQSLSVPLTKDAVTGKYSGFADFVKPSDTTRVRIYPSFTAMSGYASDVSFSIPIGGLVMTDLQKPNTVSSMIESSYNTDPFKTAVENVVGSSIEINTNSIDIASVQSAFSNAVSRGELIFKDGVLTDVNADFNYISWWGSSSIAGMTPYLTTMATSLGVANKYNGGRSGEIMQYHAARMGAVNAMVKIPTGSIPASGKVEVTCNLPNIMYSAIGTFTGYLNGVLGTFGYDVASSTQLSFTRAVSGSAIQVDPVKDYEFVPNLDQKNISGYVILNVGKNNILYNSTYNETAEDIFAYTMRMYEHVRNAFKRVIVINHYCNTNFNAKQIEITKQLNALLAKQFGNCLVDNNAYLLSEQVWIDTGLTKTQADIDATALGVLPPTLSSDPLHMNGVTSQALVDLVLKPKFQEIWF